MKGELEELRSRLGNFTGVRDWEQFHSPKNLAMAIAGETGELLEHFQWLTESQSRDLPDEKKEEVALEMADILIYLVRMADVLDIDLADSAHRKITINETRYPVEKVRGDARRAADYES